MVPTRGVPAPAGGKWWHWRVAELARNPTYKGLRCERLPLKGADGKVTRRFEYGRILHECEELVSPSIWQAAVDAIASRPKRGRQRLEKRAPQAGVLYCPRCDGSPMYRIKAGTVRTGGTGTFLYYRCTGRGADRRSCGNMVRAEVAVATLEQVAQTFR